MKKNIKMFLPVLMVASCVSMTSNVLAETTVEEVTTEEQVTEATTAEEVTTEEQATEATDEEVITEEQITETTAEEVTTEITTSVETKEVLAEIELKTVNNKKLFPIRKVAETLGYTVEWQGTTKTIALANMPHYITCTVGIDSYTVGKVAPTTLGQEPVIIDSVTYVPIELLELISIDTEVYEVSLDNNLVIYKKADTTEVVEETTEEATEEEVEAILMEVEILEIDTENNTMLVKDANLGEVSLNLNSEGLTISSSKDFEVGQTIFVQYGEAMTASIPPINNPIQILEIVENN